jgi:hypothetical protein
MVLTDNFIWTHLPRTGGTSTVAMFEVFGIMSVHADNDYRKHQTFRECIEQRLVDEKRHHVCNLRRLIPWLQSIGKCQLQYPGGIFDPQCAKQGLVYLLHNDQTRAVWLAHVDQILTEYMIPRVDTWLRTEHLKEDFIAMISRFTTVTKKQERQLSRIHKNRGIDTTRVWTKRECRQIYAACPGWAALERQVYGDLPR